MWTYLVGGGGGGLPDTKSVCVCVCVGGGGGGAVRLKPYDKTSAWDGAPTVLRCLSGCRLKELTVVHRPLSFVS